MKEENLSDAHKYKMWRTNIKNSGLSVIKIDEKFTRRNNEGQVLFSTLMLDAITPEGDKIPPICFLKGEVVCVLICLIDEKTDEKYLLLVKQRRIAEGNFTFEHPAGMVDGIMLPVEVAIKEVNEETGLRISREFITNLSQNKLLFSSPGTSDEALHFFFTEIRISIDSFASLNKRKVPTNDDYERISTHILPFVEAHSMITNTNLLLLNFMYLLYKKDFNTLFKLSNII